MISEKSGRQRLPLPYPTTERSTPTGGSDPEILRTKSRTEPRNEPLREVVVMLSPRTKIVRNDVPRSPVSWRKVSPVRCWRMQFENTTVKRARFSRTKPSCLLPGEREIPTDRNDRKSKKRPRLYVLAQVPHAHAAIRCLRRAASRCLWRACSNVPRLSRHHRRELKTLKLPSPTGIELPLERSPHFLASFLARTYTRLSHSFPRLFLCLLHPQTLALTST